MDPLLINGDKPLQHVSTLVRQLVFDVIFVVENIVLITIALNSNVRELKENQVWISFGIEQGDPAPCSKSPVDIDLKLRFSIRSLY